MRELFGSKNTIGRMAVVLKRSKKRPLPLPLQPIYICCTYFASLPKSSAVVISGMCQVDVGENCIVKEKQYGNVFDLNVLRSSEDYSLTTEQGDHYDINVCGGLNRTCNGQVASVCLTKQDRQSFAIGEV